MRRFSSPDAISHPVYLFMTPTLRHITLLLALLLLVTMTLGRSLLDSRVTQPDRAREIERPLFTQLNTATPVMPFVQHSGLDRRRKYPAPPSPYGHLPRSTSMPAVVSMDPIRPDGCERH